MSRTSRLSFPCAALLVLGPAFAGCEPQLVETEQRAAFEPDDDDAFQICSTGLAAGTKVEVCKTGGLELNLRSGPGKGYAIVGGLGADTQATILAASGSWYKLDAGGWSHSYYLCAALGGTSTPPSPSSPSSSSSSSSSSSGTCSGSFLHPAPGYPVTSEFGSCRDGCSRRHEGIDLGVPTGTSVRASDGGVVEFAGWAGGYGYVIDVQHCGKFTTRYAHLSHFLVKQGQQLARGQALAKSGNSGVGTGPHLHFEVRLGGSWGTAVNPRKYVSF